LFRDRRRNWVVCTIFITVGNFDFEGNPNRQGNRDWAFDSSEDESGESADLPRLNKRDWPSDEDGSEGEEDGLAQPNRDMPKSSEEDDEYSL
jgi:hypothetical protein